MSLSPIRCFFFFFNDTATTEIYTLSLHDALPIYYGDLRARDAAYHQGTVWAWLIGPFLDATPRPDRKSTRLNSSHSQISYAVFCLKKKTTAKYLTKKRTSCGALTKVIHATSHSWS